MSWEIDFDVATWLEVPDFGDTAEAAPWVERASRAVATDFGSEVDLDAAYPQVLAEQLRILADLAHSHADHGLLLAHLPGYEWDPFPVFVAFREPEAESPDYLLAVAGAKGMPAASPPTVEHIVTDDLGEGIRVLRYVDEPDGGLVANLCYAWRAYDTDVFLFAQTDDLARLEQIGPDLIALTSSIHPIAAGSAVGDA